MRDSKYVILVSVLLASLFFLTLESRGVGRPGEVVAWVTTPVQAVVAKVHRTAFGIWSTYLEWKRLLTENRSLREEVKRLRVEALRTQETRVENLRLRNLLELKEQLPFEALPGEVIAKEWGGWIRSLTVNRGRRDGVRRLTAVIAPGGLVGRVVVVRNSSAVIQLLNDPSSTVGAMVQRTRTPGMVVGEPGGTLRFKFRALDGDAVGAGDLVVSSGLGGLFPKGLPVGRLVEVENRVSGLFQFAQVAPGVDFARVEEVLLLVELLGVDLTPRFSMPSGSLARPGG
ncbi:MAG: rod shape-determining protein MreC [Candidatus Methylomirabilia bacterium]